MTSTSLQLIRLVDGPSCSIFDNLRILGHGTKVSVLVVGTISNQQLGSQTKPFGEEAAPSGWVAISLGMMSLKATRSSAR